MSANVADKSVKEVPLGVFGSLVTESSPSDLPAGVSPDCQDVEFVPGSVSSRRCLKRTFDTPLPAGGPFNIVPTVTYGKSYTDPSGVIRNLWLDSNGILWVENISASPGTYTMLAETTPGMYAKSITAFGREYIAVSDGIAGQEVPLQFDGTNLDRVTQDGPGAPPAIANLIIAPSSLSSLVRSGNVVTAVTSGAHGLQVGYQGQVSGVPASIVGTSVVSIVVDNENQPGVATVTTSSAHGLVPGNYINLSGVTAATIATVSSISRQGNTVTCDCTAPHGLSIGASVTLSSVSNSSFNSSFIVAQIVSPTAFVYAQVDTDAISSGGFAQLNWPLPNTAIPTFFQVLAAPSSTTFSIQLNYSDGTWTTGSVSFAWEGTFFVATVISATGYTYQQYGPDATSGAVGTVTPYGQAAPGQHQMQVMFLTRQGYITAPSPPVKFIANGGQYLQVTNLPIGPSSVIARILAFTGALGAYFFYIPAPAQVNGQVVSTATQINDNTTTSAVLDFSDNTLYASLGTSIPGNNLASQIVLDSALGFGFYGSRLLAYGQRNRINNLLNMGFDGGHFSAAATLPLGWTPSGGGGALTAGHFGEGWEFTLTASGNQGVLVQPFYEDAYSAPIGTGNTQYRMRGWFKPGTAAADLNFTMEISSTSAGFNASATVNGADMTTAGGWLEASFNHKTPNAIPADMVLKIYAETASTSTTLLVDELSVIYADVPFTSTLIRASYTNNPEAFDGVTGKFGASDDTAKVMDFGVIRNNLYIFTQDPSGSIHQTADNSTTEPSGWSVEEIASNCGALSIFAVTKAQGRSNTPSGGEEWLAWASSSGARIFGGDQPWKISQEIQPNWTGDVSRGIPGINFAAQHTAWCLNDPVDRVIYFGLPIGSLSAPSLIYPMNYRELDTPYQVAQNAPYRTGTNGRLVATDNTRKWTRWTMQTNGAALMYRSVNSGFVFTAFGGNGTPPFANHAGFGEAYTLSETLQTDDDYGQVFPYYITYFFVGSEQEEALQLGSVRKMLAYLTADVSWSGSLRIIPFVNALSNAWGIVCNRVGSNVTPTFDLEWGGGMATGQRIAFKVMSLPNGAGETDNAFSLQRIVAALKLNAHSPVRGSAQ